MVTYLLLAFPDPFPTSGPCIYVSIVKAYCYTNQIQSETSLIQWPPTVLSPCFEAIFKL